MNDVLTQTSLWNIYVWLSNEKDQPTILCDSLDDSTQELVVVDNIEEMESKKVAMEQCTSYRHPKKYLKYAHKKKNTHWLWYPVEYQKKNEYTLITYSVEVYNDHIFCGTSEKQWVILTRYPVEHHKKTEYTLVRYSVEHQENTEYKLIRYFTEHQNHNSLLILQLSELFNKSVPTRSSTIVFVHNHLTDYIFLYTDCCYCGSYEYLKMGTS